MCCWTATMRRPFTNSARCFLLLYSRHDPSFLSMTLSESNSKRLPSATDSNASDDLDSLSRIGPDLLRCKVPTVLTAANGMVRPCSGPASKRSLQGAQKKGARHVTQAEFRNRRDRHRYRQELVPRC